MSTENKKFKGNFLDENGNLIEGSEFIGWRSRSIAVTNVIMMNNEKDPENPLFLIEKRGSGCPDFIGKYVFPCGYVGWDESLREAAVRETWEELGLEISDPTSLIFAGINDSPNSNKQNITVRYVTVLNHKSVVKKLKSKEINIDTKSRGGEDDECELIKVVSYKFIKSHKSKFAFNHEELAVLVAEHINDMKQGFYVDSIQTKITTKSNIITNLLNKIKTCLKME